MRLLIHVEGPTEEDFVNEILKPYLYSYGYQNVGARIIGNARQRDRRGGIKGWPVIKRDVLRHLKEDTGSIQTLMVDYYALPESGEKAWPGRAHANSLPFSQKAAHIANELALDINGEMGPDFKIQRFIPNIVMHEFEGLLFSDCNAFAEGIGQAHLTEKFQAIRASFESPEHINDSPVTAPSKRVEALIQGYQKPLHGNLGIISIGLEKIKTECLGFRTWLETLEQLGKKDCLM